MRIEQRLWVQDHWRRLSGDDLGPEARLVLVFGASAALRRTEVLDGLRRQYPAAVLFGCSTAGEIHGHEVTDETVVVTALGFAHTHVLGASVTLAECGGDSLLAGERLAASLPLTLPGDGDGETEELRHVFVLSDGLGVNGSSLVRGLTACLPAAVPVTGGLAGDGPRFAETLVLHDTLVDRGVVAAVGFYGKHLRIGFASMGGWDPFGPERMITRSRGNVLFEFDGQSALGLYKKYLGEHAEQLPASGLLFPLSLRSKVGDAPVVRTILAVNEAAQSMTFAGDMPEGAYARLMKANFDRLIDGAIAAAEASRSQAAAGGVELAVLISCVGRKLLLKQRIEEEVEGVGEVLGPGAVLTGFYSYGEISPFGVGARCELHNQTMSITTFSEA